MPVNDKTRALADKIKAELLIDTDNGVAAEKEKGQVFEKTLPEDLTMETVVKVHDHTAAFVTAGSLAVGEIALEAFSKNEKLQSFHGELAMACKDTAAYTMQKQRVTANTLHPEKGDIVKYGVMTASYEFHGTGNSSGQMKQVREHLWNTAADLFGEK